jgi:hypothetical protein
LQDALTSHQLVVRVLFAGADPAEDGLGVVDVPLNSFLDVPMRGSRVLANPLDQASGLRR